MAKLHIVGFGPGCAENMTRLAESSLNNADAIVGYTGYIKRLRPLFPGKNYYETGMTQEIERCRLAIELAKTGKTVCIVSSGDSGVYGMASLIFELTADVPDIDIEVVPGVTAAISGAALLGAPLAHDFAVISLSDLLTPWETIEKRLRLASAGDFVICLYNPGSKTRAEYLGSACDILLETIPADRLCGIARDIGREAQSVSLLTLWELRQTQANMNETIFIGNSQTRHIKGRMVTPRGYND
jgi:precorrin-3B C17-methyltransferase